MARILLTVPTWNEATCIAANLRTLHAACTEVLGDHAWSIEVADNGSTDRTAACVQDVMTSLPQIALREIVSRGKGGAIRESWLAHRATADVFVFLDADLAADVRALGRLVRPIVEGTADCVCGSRFLLGTKTERSCVREGLSRLFRFWQRAMLHLPVRDAQCGFKAVSLAVVEDILPRMEERTWLFDTEMLALAHQASMRIVEVPVDWVEHRHALRRSALRVWKDGWLFLVGVLRIRRRKNLSTVFR